MDFRGDSNLASFGAAGCEAPGCPSSSRFLLRLRRSLQVSPRAASSGFYRRLILEADRESNPSAVPIDRFRVATYSDPSVSPTTKF